MYRVYGPFGRVQCVEFSVGLIPEGDRHAALARTAGPPDTVYLTQESRFQVWALNLGPSYPDQALTGSQGVTGCVLQSRPCTNKRNESQSWYGI